MSASSAPQTVLLPNVELNMESVTVTNVFVKNGDKVVEGQALGAVETQKANIEIPSPYAGFVQEVFIKEGDEIGERAPVCTIGDSPAAEASEPVVTPSPKECPVPASLAGDSILPSSSPTVTGKVRASPLARKVARDLKLDLHRISGTGPSGRISRSDVEKFAQSGGGAGEVRAETPKETPRRDEGWESFPPGRMGIIGQMEAAAKTIPLFSLSRLFDVTNLVRKEAGITFTHRLIARLGVALGEHPSLLTTIDGARFRIEQVSVAVAMDTKSGLLAPVVRGPNELSLPEIAATVQLLKARGDAGQLKRPDLERAPFALSNLGMFGVDQFQPSVFAGQCAVLGVGRATDGAAGRKFCWFTLACDHRAVDGAEAARFLGTLQREILTA